MMKCIECGAGIQVLYKEYSKGSIRLTVCEACHNTADKYVEYEPILILIDLMLHKPQAYRHILYNYKPPLTASRVYKMAFILVLLDMNMKAYLVEHRQSIFLREDYSYSEKDISLFEVSQLTGHVLLLSMLENFIYMATIVLTIRYNLFGAISANGEKKWSSILHESGYTRLVGSILISSFGKLFIMLSVIWRYHWLLIHIIGASVVASNYMVLSIYLNETPSLAWNVVLLVAVAVILRGACQVILYSLGNPMIFLTII